MTFAPYRALLFFMFLYILMSLPIDPEECPWTPEGQEYYEERARRAYYARLAQMEEQEEHSLRRASR